MRLSLPRLLRGLPLRGGSPPVVVLDSETVLVQDLHRHFHHLSNLSIGVARPARLLGDLRETPLKMRHVVVLTIHSCPTISSLSGIDNFCLDRVVNMALGHILIHVLISVSIVLLRCQILRVVFDRRKCLRDYWDIGAGSGRDLRLVHIALYDLEGLIYDLSGWRLHLVRFNRRCHHVRVVKLLSSR